MSFAKRVVVTGGTFIAANALSNCVLFPDKKLDHGFANRLLGREVRSEWWGTRTAHVLAIAWPLAVMDHLSIDLWNKVLLPKLGLAPGTKLSFHATPGPILVHGFTFALAGITIYVGFDAYFNPNIPDDKRMEAVTSKLYPEIRGCHTMWVLPVTTAILASLTKKPVVHGTLLGLIPPTVAFTTVKGTSWAWPWNSNLTAFEKELNSEGYEQKRAALEAAKAVLKA